MRRSFGGGVVTSPWRTPVGLAGTRDRATAAGGVRRRSAEQPSWPLWRSRTWPRCPRRLGGDQTRLSKTTRGRRQKLGMPYGSNPSVTSPRRPNAQPVAPGPLQRVGSGAGPCRTLPRAEAGLLIPRRIDDFPGRIVHHHARPTPTQGTAWALAHLLLRLPSSARGCGRRAPRFAHQAPPSLPSRSQLEVVCGRKRSPGSRSRR